MVFVKILDGPAVRYYMPLEIPVIPQNVPKKAIAAAAWFTVYAIIRSHNGFYLSFLHTGLKGRKIGFLEILS